jgi:hypothetical protein
MKKQELAGRRFERLTVISRATVMQGYNSMWNCICDCGQQRLVRGSHLISGAIKSCGCLSREKSAVLHFVHGSHGTPTYRSWLRMRGRCYDPKNNEFHNYGARGIKVCDAWRWSFSEFLKDMGERPSLHHSIDRINGNLDYDKSNCRWATASEQQNNKRTNHLLTLDGVTLTLRQWERKMGLGRGRIGDRLRYGWEAERAVNQPVL